MAVQLIEARLKLGEGGLGARCRLSHRIQYQLRLRRRLGRRRGDSSLNPGKPTPGITEIRGRLRSNPKSLTAGWNFTTRNLTNWEPQINPKPRGWRLESDTNCYTCRLAGMVAGVRHTIA
jgi:hypothetical protein